MKPSSIVWLLAVCFASGCETEILFENGIPGASVENVRWVTESGHAYDQESDERLEPGDSTNPIRISEDDEGESGRIHFELLVRGRKVALVTAAQFAPETGSSKTFKLLPTTRATNPLVKDD